MFQEQATLLVLRTSWVLCLEWCLLCEFLINYSKDIYILFDPRNYLKTNYSLYMLARRTWLISSANWSNWCANSERKKTRSGSFPRSEEIESTQSCYSSDIEVDQVPLSPHHKKRTTLPKTIAIATGCYRWPDIARSSCKKGHGEREGGMMREGEKVWHKESEGVETKLKKSFFKCSLIQLA